MGWPAAFRERLARGDPYRHRVRSLPGPSGSESAPAWTLTAGHESLGVVISAEGSSTAGAHLDVPSWNSSIGGFTIGLVGDGRPLLQRIWKGQFVAHEVSFDGTAWEPVQLGVVDELHRTGDQTWALDCLDGLAALRTRYTTNEREQPLFSLYGLTDAEDASPLTGASAFLDEQYNPGNEATLSVSSNTQNPGLPGVPMSLVGDSDGARLACITPHLARRFYYRYTGTSGSTTLVADDYPRDDVYGTRAKVTAAGAIIQTVPFVEGHPCDIFRKILASNGRTSDDTSAAANGPWNTLPRTWGYGIPNWLIDHEDMDDWVRLTSPASGSADWTMICEQEQRDGLGYLQAWFARGGFFPTIRQGRYSLRAVVDPAGMTEALANTATHFGRLSGRYIVPGSMRWSAWGGSSAVEYRRVRVYTGNLTPTSTVSEIGDIIRSQPCEDEYPVPLQDTIWSNESAHHRLLLQRLAPWTLCLSERLDVECVHPLARGLAPGDIVLLDMPHLGGRDVTVNGGVYDGRPAMLTGCDPDWFNGGPTKLTFATPPPAWWRS